MAKNPRKPHATRHQEKNNPKFPRSSAPLRKPAPPKNPDPRTEPPLDKVEEADIESFPASDAPGYGTGHAG